jgi:hypothetical protein
MMSEDCAWITRQVSHWGVRGPAKRRIVLEGISTMVGSFSTALIFLIIADDRQDICDAILSRYLHIYMYTNN